MTWHFRTMARSEVNQDPVEGEFFAPEEGYAAALVRETIQNMLDNRADQHDRNAPVRARFAFGRAAGTEHTVASSPWLAGLHPHLQALGVPNRPEGGEPLTFLLVEDSGTRGLCGDETHHADTQQEEDAPKNDFYYFWRNVGRSKKGSTDRGRWGLGKTVFPASSRALSFFGLTKRSSDNRLLLMGQCVGKIHEMQGNKFAAYGYFGRIEDDGFALPLEDLSIITEFEDLFGLQREEAPGLSVIVPFPQPELQPDTLLREVVRNYYLPILFGELVVDLQDVDGMVTTVDAASLVTLAGQLDEGMRQVIAFAQAVIDEPADRRVVLGTLPAGAPPAWDAESIFAAVDLAELRRRYAEGQLLSIRVPMTVELLASGERRSSFFDLYLQRDGRLERGRGDFVRQGLTITNVNRPPKGAVRGLVLVSDPPLSSLLGDSEGPAHTRWEERRERVKRYRYGSSTVRFVSRALSDVSELLTQQQSGIDENALIDMFFLPDPQQTATNPARRTPAATRLGRDVNPPPTVPPLPRRPRRFNVTQKHGGFGVAGVSTADGHSELIRVTVGYLTDNARIAYSPFDFDLGRPPITVSAVGAAYRASGNVLEILPDTPEFTVEVLGFDVNRDLDVNAKD